MTERKLVYIASPYAGDVERNIEFARAACQHCIEQGYTPIAVHLLYTQPGVLDDTNPAERETGLKLGRHVLEHCDELWQCGNRISSGMAAEIERAKQLGIPVISVTAEQILDAPGPVYAIWAKGRPDGSLAGQSGFLCENRKRMYFDNPADAAVRIKDIQNLCLNGQPAADYSCVEYPAELASQRRMHLETLKDLDMLPSFDPNRFEVIIRSYGNTGGGCMVGTAQFHLPELDKSAWVNCNDEGVTITSADYVWNEDNSESWERYEDVLLYHTEFEHELPEDGAPWLPMIKEALAYTVEQQTAHYREGYSFPLPVAWLPEPIRQKAEPEYLDWLQAEGKPIRIGNGTQVMTDEAYPQAGQLGIGPMELQ